MKLITPELEQRFKEVGEQSEFENPILLAKFYAQEADVAWYPIMYDPSLNCCYGYVTGFLEDEFTSFSINRLDIKNEQYGNVIKQDSNFQEVRFEELFPQLERLSELDKEDNNRELEQEL